MAKKTKSVTMFRSDAIFLNGPENDPEFSTYKHNETTYDEFGNITSEIRYAPDGTETDKQIFKYDEKGQLIEEINYLDTGEIAEHMTYERNENKQVVKAFKHYLDGSTDTIVYKRDENGNVIEKLTLDSEDEVEAKEIMVYENNRLINHKFYEFNELVMEESFIYDDKGNIISQYKWEAEENEKIRFDNFYNDNGDLIKSLKFNNEEKLVERYIYERNKNSLPVSIEEESSQGKIITRIEYDDKGNAIKQTETDENGNINNQIIRKYDSNSLLTESEVYINIRLRAITQEYTLKYEYAFFDED